MPQSCDSVVDSIDCDVVPSRMVASSLGCGVCQVAKRRGSIASVVDCDLAPSRSVWRHAITVLCHAQSSAIICLWCWCVRLGSIVMVLHAEAAGCLIGNDWCGIGNRRSLRTHHASRHAISGEIVAGRFQTPNAFRSGPSGHGRGCKVGNLACCATR